MNKNNILFGLITFTIALLLCSGIVDASLGTVRQNDCINIRVLANCTEVNITEVTNGANEYVLNAVMTNLGGQTFNYTFCNTSTLGTYDYSWNNICVDCSQGDCGNSFEVTATGTDFTIAEGIIYVVVLLISLAILLLCLYGAVKIRWRNKRSMDGSIISINDLKYVKLVLWFFSYLILMWVTWICYGITKNFMQIDIASGLFNVIFNILLTALLPLTVTSVVIALIVYLADRRLAENMLRGLPTR